MIKCSECGYENMDGLDYCDGCGAKLESVAPGPHGSAEQPPPAPSSASVGTAEATTANEAAGVSEAVVSEPGAAGVQPAAAAGAPATSQAEPSNEHVAVIEPSAGASETHSAAATVAPTGAAPFKAKLSIIRGGRRGQEFELEPGNNLVGRWDPETGAFPEVDLDADDPEAKVSRKHALIRIDSGRITIEDIGSLNGTYVNRQPRLQPGNPVDLKDGDEIIIGKTFLKLSISPIS